MPVAPHTSRFPAISHLLYLHGFRSSPQSNKAQQMARHMSDHHPGVVWYCPQLPPSPQEAMAHLVQTTADWPADRMAVIGSSLGGFYATALAEQRGCRAVLVNPAVHPARDLAAYIGAQSQWHAPEENFYFHAHYVDELRALQVGPLLAPQQYLALIAKGDEVLDWREMVGRYQRAQVTLLEGGDHALSDFADYLPQVMQFLGLE
ncbi:MAG: YqiA/YcfP family alpha/beta fold hydrolase [Rhodoferax sp.]|nr:YqiA/YcfP family alpha/beta fold hydrolase [Rhodoferax sp.]